MPRIYDYVRDADIASLFNLLLARTNTRAFSGGTLAAKATADADLKTTTTINYALNGKCIIQAAAATIDVSGLAGCVAGVAAGTWTQAAAKYAAYLLTLASGTWNLLKGLDAATSAAALMLLPACPANVCPVGMVVVTNTTNPFIFGTTNSDAAGVTFTCSDLSDIVNGLGSCYLDTITQ
jgi:hypothetical protein